MRKENNKRVFSTGKAILTVFLGLIILIVSEEVSNLPGLLSLPESITAIAKSILIIVFTYYLIKFCCEKILRISLEECRISKTNVNGLWMIVAVVLPVSVSTILLCTSGELVKNDMSVVQMANLLVSEIFVVGIGASVLEEMIFRGFIMTALEMRWGKIVSIVVPSVIFGLLHASGGMNVIDMFMLLVAGTSVGIMFSLIVYESGSIWSSVVVHVMWNVLMDGGILNISDTYNEHAIYSYTLSSHSFIFTGGAFGVGASIISIIFYLAVILLALCLMKGKTQKTNPLLTKT